MYFFLQNSVGFSVWICNVEVLIFSNSYLILLGEIWLISSCRVGRVCSRVFWASSMLSAGHFFSKISLIRIPPIPEIIIVSTSNSLKQSKPSDTLVSIFTMLLLYISFCSNFSKESSLISVAIIFFAI